MPAVKLLRIKDDMPTVEAARRRLIEELRAAKREGWRAVKLIHGYGSSGAGGALRDALRKSLTRRRKEGLIRAFVTGERWTAFDPEARKILDECKELSHDADLEKSNEGVTLILL